MKKQKHKKRKTVTGFGKDFKAMQIGGRASMGNGNNHGIFDGGLPTVTGVIDCKGDRFGFINCAADGDVFIAGSCLNGARHGDTVRALIVADRMGRDGGRRREGRVLEIIEPAIGAIVGTVVHKDKEYCIVPDDRHFGELLPVLGLGGAREHDKVVVELVATVRGDCAKVLAVLGRRDEIGMDVKSVIAAHRLRTDFPNAVIEQASAYGDKISEREARAAYRRDFRDKIVFTIDGNDSKDFDDAVSIERTDAGYRLGVYIADVAEYVPERSPLDEEALRRGTSVYLADRVIPMLPEALSNGLCSLNEGEDRLVLAAIIDLDAHGNRVSAELTEGVIRSAARLTYAGVQAILDGDVALRERYAAMVPSLEIMKELALERIKLRKNRGAIEFELTETEIEFDSTGRVTDIAPKPRLFSMQIIEEFMILANCAVAERFATMEKVPFVYRVHERPSADKLCALNDYFEAVGCSLRCPESPTPAQVAKLLEQAPDEIGRAVSRVTLRAMAKADYRPENKGHFGLAETFYCHFTSPIRRYPDLAIHRIIKTYLRDGVAAIGKYRDFVVDASIKSSKAERTAQDCERKVDDFKKAEYMSRHIGERFSGTVSSVTEFGLFVELENTAEGLVRMSSLPPAAVFDAKCLRISCGRLQLKLGDTVNVIVDKADGDRVEFVLG